MRTVAIVSPGNMGHSIGAVLRQGGLRVITCLQGRSERTRRLAAEAGFEDVPDYETLVRDSDVILSVLAPASAHSVAGVLAAAIKRSGARPLVVDCNAIAPQTVRSIDQIITATGARFVDAGIIGPPPTWGGTSTRMYASGHDAEELARLQEHGLDVRVVGDEIGLASGLKMCYAALTKGLMALAAEQQIAAAALGLSQPLLREMETSQAGLLTWIRRLVPDTPAKAHRFVGEMTEIAATFETAGLPPGMMLGAAEMFRRVADSSLGIETTQNRDQRRSMEEIAQILAQEFAAKAPSKPE